MPVPMQVKNSAVRLGKPKSWRLRLLVTDFDFAFFFAAPLSGGDHRAIRIAQLSKRRLLVNRN